ncbi:MBL fold metallo-hydrolase [Plantactinospora soyae]|uniref:Glyoxylase-like metal-dependent hydrolase (Beta-lactamase superfamily II) n=1 Tax=Plantactinospora soyae TaxID=1544732 RepID=A0A927MEC2_9ACTN|nr:MBL fold metallo-hydrolase [Plantactinospora soyae]MBE1490208.1 glyoxylase-like metal-dependent hydrolase (beta-lactamase superfamily II) [Plantactinospora soyae]
MRVHHLNCATMRPASRRLINGTGGLFEPGLLVCHCLLVETEQGLVLIDSGIGSADIRDPVAALGEQWLRRTRPRLELDETAVRQVARLGYRPQDVRHIVLTHLHRDHAGGISDFPWATVHVLASEHEAALHPGTPAQRLRYRPSQWAHQPTWATYANTGERWFGFDAVRQLDGLPPEILLVPLPGHSPGHTGVAVDTGARWLLHAGDAYFFHRETDPEGPRSTLGLRLFQRKVQVDGSARRHNQVRLLQLRAAHGERIDIFSAHDPVELERHR